MVRETTVVEVYENPRGLKGDEGDQGPQGPPGDLGNVPDRDALRAITTRFNGMARWLNEGKRKGLFVFSTDNLQAVVTADTEEGYAVAPLGEDGSLGAWVRFQGIDTWLYSKHFGADEAATAAQNTASLTAWANVAALLDRPRVLNTGEHRVTAKSGSGRIQLPMGPSKKMQLIYEDGASVVRDDVPAGQMATSAYVMAAEAVQDGIYHFKNVEVSGNEANVPYDASTFLTLYQFEQAANFKFYTGAEGPNVVLEEIRTENMRMLDAVGDGFSQNFPCRNFTHEGFVELGRTRRVRSGLQLGPCTGLGVVRAFYGSYLESEPGGALPVGHRLVLEGVICTENLDLAGYDVNSLLNVSMRGVYTLRTNPNHPGQRFSLACCEGAAEDCYFSGTDMVKGNNQLYMNKMDFSKCWFEVSVNPADATQAVPFVEWKDDATGSYHRFHDCFFKGPAGITSFAAYVPPSGVVGSVLTGGYIQPQTSNASADVVTAFYNCKTDENLPYLYYARNAGTVIISGGTPRGKTAVARFSHTVGFVTHLFIERPERFPKAGLGKLLWLSGSSGVGSINLSGALDGELMGLTVDGTNPANTTHNNSLYIFVDSSPQARLRGLPEVVAQLRHPAALTADQWVYRNGATAGANNTWETARLAVDTDGTLAANSDSRAPTQKAVKTYADGINTALTTALAAKAPLASPQFTGVAFYQQPAPTAKNATATLTIAELLSLIITSTSASAVSLTLPTGTLTDAGILGGALPVNEAFEWYLINLGSGTGAVTLLVGATHTIVGNAVTAIGTSSRWLTRKTAANTFVTYRIA